ncbi:MAG: FdtA/QdtA family cupin domain-containing protein [Bacteroidales bacterium]|nr:FdtA/QdtA family cupin domain-containing protein [Bacteroidales bacterium]
MNREARIINLPKIEDDRGNLSFAEELSHIPFAIKRLYWLFDVPGGGDRDGHAYRNNEEVIIALSGSFLVDVEDGSSKKTFYMNRSYFGLYVPSGTWRTIRDFSTNSLALLVASEPYDERDYIRDYRDFIKMKEDGGI